MAIMVIVAVLCVAVPVIVTMILLLTAPLLLNRQRRNITIHTIDDAQHLTVLKYYTK